MSLYVKVFTSFYTCKKTIRLQAVLGDDALWIPPRLWAYAAQNQPNGDFSDYSGQEIALLLGYNKDAARMLQALQQVGFLDGMQVHDWGVYNAYHETFSERAKAAAEARWAKHNEKKQAKEDKTREDKSRKETSIASSMREACSKHKAETLEIVSDYCTEIGLPKSDGISCWEKWTGNGWRNGGNAIKDWKATIRSWKSQGYLPSQKEGSRNEDGFKLPNIGS